MRTLSVCAVLVMSGCAGGPPAATREAGAAAVRVELGGGGEAAYVNNSAGPVWVWGDASDSPHYQLQVLDPGRGEWVNQLGWCGTGAAFHAVAPGESRRFRVDVPAAGPVRRVELPYYESPGRERKLARSELRVD